MTKAESKKIFPILMFLYLNSCISSSPQRDVAQVSKGQEQCKENYPAEKYPKDFENGYFLLDVLEPKKVAHEITVSPIMCQRDKKEVKDLNLQAFKPLYLFNKPSKKMDIADKKSLPWLGKNWDVTKKADAEKVAKVLQKYVYEGWFDQDDTRDKIKYETHFRENKLRTWCHTPWLNITERGREAIHGLTKEFPIHSSSVYTIPNEIETKKLAVTWGLAFFNQPVCNSYATFFRENGMIDQVQENSPSFSSGDGSVSFKLLFNTMDDWRNKMEGQWTSKSSHLEAYNWWAHVSNEHQDGTSNSKSVRKIRNIAHVQMDIGLKDSRLKGTNPFLQNWIMTTYYFDPDYYNEFLKDMAIPEPLKHMRPAGLQYGLDAGKSHIFEDANNNHRPGANIGGNGTELPYSKTRLNGPVDNIEGSCLGCHATSGLRFNASPKIPPMVFGSEKQYEEFLKVNNISRNGNFDFNMQVDKAMRNFLNTTKSDGPKHPDAQK